MVVLVPMAVLMLVLVLVLMLVLVLVLVLVVVGPVEEKKAGVIIQETLQTISTYTEARK